MNREIAQIPMTLFLALQIKYHLAQLIIRTNEPFSLRQIACRERAISSSIFLSYWKLHYGASAQRRFSTSTNCLLGPNWKQGLMILQRVKLALATFSLWWFGWLMKLGFTI